MQQLILYCRPGFEKETIAELIEQAATLGIYGIPRAESGSGYVIFECFQVEQADLLVRTLRFDSLIFARQWIVTGEAIQEFPNEDRVAAVLAALPKELPMAGEVRVEVPENDSAKMLLPFCRKFTVPLRKELRSNQRLTSTLEEDKLVLHVFFVEKSSCYVGYSYPNNSAPFFMGIPRLRFPTKAPSRSTLKLEEAFHHFIPKVEQAKRLASGMSAVDLGAAPGGWSYQLVQRNIKVYAIDNGPMDPALLQSGLVIPVQEDGFRYRPKNDFVNWLVCDIVEQPKRVINLMIQWVVNGWCQEAIFNLKLPMKRRYEEVQNSLKTLHAALHAANIVAEIEAKHLYHDREEITVHVRRLTP